MAGKCKIKPSDGRKHRFSFITSILKGIRCGSCCGSCWSKLSSLSAILSKSKYAAPIHPESAAPSTKLSLKHAHSRSVALTTDKGVDEQSKDNSKLIVNSSYEQMSSMKELEEKKSKSVKFHTATSFSKGVSESSSVNFNLFDAEGGGEGEGAEDEETKIGPTDGAMSMSPPDGLGAAGLAASSLTAVSLNNPVSVFKGPGMGYLRRKELEKEQQKEAQRLQALEAQRLFDLTVTDWLEWRCLVCARENRRPRYPKEEYNIVFKERGMRYKRDIAVLVPHPSAPKCVHCLTPADYVPPLCTAHIFPHNPRPEAAFEAYPLPVQVPAGLPQTSTRLLHRLHARLMSFLFGVRDSRTSNAITNDWRLPFYLSSRFPEVPRPVMSAGGPSLSITSGSMPSMAPNVRMSQSSGADRMVSAGSRSSTVLSSSAPLFEVGETVECHQQKKDWSRAKVLVARTNKTYDIRYALFNMKHLI